MLLLTVATALAGFLTSVALLKLHLHVMWLRYGLSVGVAYGVFLALIWCWVRNRTAIAGNGPNPPPSRKSGGFSPDWFDALEADDLVSLAAMAAVAMLLIAVVWTVSLILAAPELVSEVVLDGAAGAAHIGASRARITRNC